MTRSERTDKALIWLTQEEYEKAQKEKRLIVTAGSTLEVYLPPRPEITAVSN